MSSKPPHAYKGTVFALLVPSLNTRIKAYRVPGAGWGVQTRERWRTGGKGFTAVAQSVLPTALP